MLRIFIISCVLILSVHNMSAQARLFNKKQNRIDRATKNLEKRKKAAGEDDLNMGAMKMKDLSRTDFLWNPNTAYTLEKFNGDISITQYSRLAISKKDELQTNLGADFFIPNLFIKHNWYKKKFYISTRHGLYSSSPGLNWAQNKGYNQIVDSTLNLPFIGAIKNELIFSFPFWDSANCNAKKEYMVLTAAVSADYGLKFNNGDSFTLDFPFLADRTSVLAGNGLLIVPRIQFDANLTQRMFIRAKAEFFTGDMKYNAFEQQTNIEYILFKNFSISAGYVFAYSKNSYQKVAILPFADLTIYFGKMNSRQSNLFDRKMF